MLTIRGESLAGLLEPFGIQLDQLAAQASMGTAFHPVPRLELTVTTAVQEVGGFAQPNTVGILEGSDPELRDEYIVFSAHMDHVGVGRPNEEGDSIYNGADDDASGTVAVVEVAEAMAMLAERPKRSMIFLGVSGEERGLWGSRFFAENPPVPLEQIVANLNADMVSRNWPDTVVAIGKEHSDLGETLNRVNLAHPELHMTAIDDIWPEQNFYRRSDHFNFARRGVPILFFFTGTHEDYHRPTDDLSRMDADKGARITQLLFYLGLEVANAPERPQWDPDSYTEIVDMGGGGGR
jgi:Zn-dependent M28 family amino/carboxypeptidase